MPLGPRVLVRVLHQEDVAESGLFLPAGAKERLQEALYGEVVEVARAEPTKVEEGFGLNVAGVPHGAKVLFAKDTRRVLGAGIVCINAGELIAETVLALETGADAEDLSLTIHAHPTLSETVFFAAEIEDGTITDLLPTKR